MAVYIGHDECQVIYVARNGQQLRVSSVWVGDQQVFPPANREEIHVFTRDTQGYGRADNGTHFAFTVPVPWWAASMDVVVLGAGEKGQDGTKSIMGGSDGAGGKSGAWVVKTIALTPAEDAVVRIGKGTSTSPHATDVVLPGVGGHPDVRVHDGEGARTSNSGSTGGTPSPYALDQFGITHRGGLGGSRNNPGIHPGGGGGGGQGAGLIGNPTSGQPGGDGYVWLLFRSAPALTPGGDEFVLRVGVASGFAYDSLRGWVVGIGKTHETITEITVPVEVVGPSLNSLFYDCLALASVPDLDTSQVTDMGSMFEGCSSLPAIPALDTSQVTTMHSMFNGCSSLATVPALDTSRVTNMYLMFRNCSSLTSIPELDTSQVTTMHSMFVGCSSLPAIPALDTSSVTTMRSMFNGCSSLPAIPALDTSSVTNMYLMFRDCSSLTSIPELDTSSVTTMYGMFYNCRALTSVPALDTSRVTNMYYMFYFCRALTTVPALNASRVTNTDHMFTGCSSLTAVTLPGMGNAFTTNKTLGMQDTKLNTAAANALMQSLGTPTPGGTLQLPSTAAGADTSIATAKNWTVTIG